MFYVQDALLLAQASSEGSTPFARGDNDDRLVTNDEEYYNKLVTLMVLMHLSLSFFYFRLVVNCCNGIAHRFYQSADPYNAASIHLAHDDVKSAVNYLFKVGCVMDFSCFKLLLSLLCHRAQKVAQ